MTDQRREESDDRPESRVAVTFTHQQVSEYSKISCVGQYLLAAHLINQHFRHYVSEIGVLFDFGCGAGKSSRALSSSVRPGGRIIGGDISPEFVQEARRIAEDFDADLGPAFEFLEIQVRNDDEHIPIESGAVDAVTSTIVIQEFQSESLLRNAIRELGRIAKIGAHLAIICVSDKIQCEDFTAFSYKPFPENKNADSNIRKCISTVSNIVWESDRHWSSDILLNAFQKAGWSDLEVTYPLASNDIPPFPQNPEIQWKDETHTSPFLFLTGIRK